MVQKVGVGCLDLHIAGLFFSPVWGESDIFQSGRPKGICISECSSIE